MRNKNENKKDWFNLIVIFLLGLLIASNGFIYLLVNQNDQEMDKLSTEIEKLKSDDIAIAQAINSLIDQLKSN